MALALLFAGLLLHSFFNRGPKFQGKPAKYWANAVVRGDKREHGVAVIALLDLGPEASVPVLIQALESKRGLLYREIWRKLPAVLRTRLPNPMVELNNRYRVAQVLGEFGPTARAAVPQLIVALQYPSSELKAAVATALGEIGLEARPAIPLLDALAKDTGNSEFVNTAARAALKKISDGADIPSPR